MFRGSIIGPKKLEKRLSEISDQYSSDDDDSENDIAAALSRAQQQIDLKRSSMQDLLEAPEIEDAFHELAVSSRSDLFHAHPNSPVADLFEVKSAETSFSSEIQISPRRVMNMKSFMVSSIESSDFSRLDAKVLEDGHDSFDFSVVQFSPQHTPKGQIALGKHFAAATGTAMIDEDNEEKISIAEFSGQWQTMQHSPTEVLSPSPATPLKGHNAPVLRRSSYETPKRRDVSSRTVTSCKSQGSTGRPMPMTKLCSRSAPATPVTAGDHSPEKRAQTTGTTRSKRTVKLKASVLGLDEGATASDIKAALEKVSPNKLKAALEKLIESDDDDEDRSQGRRAPIKSSRSVTSHKERSRSKGARKTSRDDASADSTPLQQRHHGRSRSSSKVDSKDKTRSRSSRSQKGVTNGGSRVDKSNHRSRSKSSGKQRKVSDNASSLSPSSFPFFVKDTGAVASRRNKSSFGTTQRKMREGDAVVS